MHTATLFLFSLFAGAISTPAYRASLRLKRADEALVVPNDVNTELPPLPLEFEEEGEIYMSIDDPRVGTVDEEGNVLVPVDEDGRILPGFEHLIRPVQESNPNPEITKGDDQSGSIQSEGAASSDDTESTNYDENAIDTSGARLPAAGDYVDSREVEAEQNRKTDAPAVVAEPDLTGLESVFQAEKEEASEDISEVGQKIGELVNEILELSPEINESIPSNAVGEEDSSDAGISEADNSNVDTVDEEIVEDRPVFIADSQDDSEEDNTRPEIGQGVQEIARALPVDEEKVELDSTLFRKGDTMGQGVKAKKRPSSAAFSSTFLSLIFTVVLYVSRL